jgi:hypothetical protein
MIIWTINPGIVSFECFVQSIKGYSFQDVLLFTFRCFVLFDADALAVS